MRTRKGGNSSTGAKRPRLEPELEETSIVGNLMHHFAQKFEERMQKKGTCVTVLQLAPA